MKIIKVHRSLYISTALAALSALIFAALATIALATPATGRTDVLIGFKNTPGASEQALVRAFGGEVSQSFSLVSAVAASVPTQAINGLRNHPLVTVVEIDGEVHAIDTELENTWGVKKIGAGDAHVAGHVGLGVRVAIIDTGIDYTHPELKDNYAGGRDFVNKDDDPMDDNGHGTHVAGTVAAVKNGVGVVGAAPSARLYALKVLNASGSGSWSNIIAALDWAVGNSVRVTNNSYGSGSDPGTIVKAAFDNSAALGVLHIAAAGNSGNRRGTGDNVGYPARYDSVVAVAATDKDNKRASFSSTGPAVELAAPGVSINSTWLNGTYRLLSGTSMASPHVAGTAALVMAADSSKSATQVRAILQNTALDLGASGRDNHFGFGLVRAWNAVLAVLPP